MNPSLPHFKSAWAIIDVLPLSVFIKDRESRFLYVNRASALSLGLDDPSKAVGMTDRDFFQPHAAQEWFALEQEMMMTGKAIIDHIAVEHRLGTKGPSPWILACKQPMWDDAGNIVGLIGISKTFINRIVKAVENANDGLWYRNYRTGEVWYSERWKAMLGYNDKDIPNERGIFQSLVFPDDWPDLAKAYSKHLSGQSEYFDCVFRMRHSDGHWRWIHSRGRACGTFEASPEEFAGSHTDITNYKVDMDLYKEILEMLPVLVFLKDKDRRFQYVNKTLEDFLNLQRGDIIGKTHEEVDPDNEHAKKFRVDDEKILCGDMNALMIEDEPLTYRSTLEVRRLQTLKRFLRYPSNDPRSHLLGVSTDVTATLAAKEQLRLMRDSLSAKLKALTELVVHIEKSTCEKDACETAILQLQEVGVIFGYPSVMISFKHLINGRPCIVGEPDYATGVWTSIAPLTTRFCDVPPYEMDIIVRVLENGKAEYVEDSRTHVACDQGLAKANGIVSQYVIPLYTASLRIGTLQIAMGEGKQPPEACDYYDAIAAHLSVAIERHRALLEISRVNDELLNQAHIVAFEAAAAKILHELNHSIGDYAKKLKIILTNSRIRSNREALEFLESTQKSVASWVDSVEENIKALGATEFVSDYDPEMLVNEVIGLWYSMAKSRSCALRGKFNIANVKGRGRLRAIRELFSCLIINAIEANARSIEIRVEVERTSALSTDGHARNYIAFTISDDGDGIPSEFKDKVGTFGWTTKGRKGHGMGITIVELLAKRSGGGFTLKSCGKCDGDARTEFVVLLPAVNEQVFEIDNKQQAP